MNPEVASIMSYFYKLFPCKVYTKKVPENFTVPCLYFPEPFSFDSNDTTSTFKKTYNLSVKLFHKDSKQAYYEAERLSDALRAKRWTIPLLNEKGENTGDFIRFDRVETRVGDDGVCHIILNWASRYYFERQESAGIDFVDFQSEVKENG